MTDELRSALEAWSLHEDAGTLARVHAALVDAVVLLPVRAVALAEGVAAGTGLPAEREAELSLLTVTLPDGRQVLPVFTGTDDLRRWQIDARPVQASMRSACRAALDEGWSGLVLDVASHGFVVGPAVAAALAEGALPVVGPAAPSSSATSAPSSVSSAASVPSVGAPLGQGELAAALRRAVAREPAVAAAWLLEADPVTVALRLKVSLDEQGLATIVERLARRLVPYALTVMLVEAEDPPGGRRLWP